MTRKSGDALTERETQAMDLLCEGHTTKQIATKLEISAHTTKFHLANSYTKLGAINGCHAVAIYVKRRERYFLASIGVLSFQDVAH